LPTLPPVEHTVDRLDEGDVADGVTGEGVGLNAGLETALPIADDRLAPMDEFSVSGVELGALELAQSREDSLLC
jgi:hypothetical protein